MADGGGADVADHARAPDIVVLESFRTPRPTTNPYITQLAQALAATPGVRLLTFDWRTALTGHYDVVHLHWPEILVARRGRVRTAVSLVRTTVWVARLRLRGTPVVRTVHNRQSHEDVPRWGRRLLAELDRMTLVQIELNPAASGPLNPVTPAGVTADPNPDPDPDPDPDPTVAGGAVTLRIPHGDYTNWYTAFPAAAATPGRVAAVGLLRRYKRTDELIQAVRGTDADDDVSLRVAGSAPDPRWAAHLVELAAADPRVVLNIAHLDDAAFVREITAATLIALPYERWHNSGAALAALSLGRPVLVPDLPATRALAAEVGTAWVRVFTTPLRPADLIEAVAAGVPEGRPDLTARRWTDAGSRHLAAFRTAQARRRGRRPT